MVMNTLMPTRMSIRTTVRNILMSTPIAMLTNITMNTPMNIHMAREPRCTIMTIRENTAPMNTTTRTMDRRLMTTRTES